MARSRIVITACAIVFMAQSPTSGLELESRHGGREYRVFFRDAECDGGPPTIELPRQVRKLIINARVRCLRFRGRPTWALRIDARGWALRVDANIYIYARAFDQSQGAVIGSITLSAAQARTLEILSTVSGKLR